LAVLYSPENEHFGIVPLEGKKSRCFDVIWLAMCAAKPVVACNSGGPTETVLHNQTGFLCPSTPMDFALAMQKFLENPQLAQTMGRKAQAHVYKNFSPANFRSELDRIIKSVLSWATWLSWPSFHFFLNSFVLLLFQQRTWGIP
jgi:alpha-1,3/alpha-1,6-mannosyltransferase